MHHDDKGDGVLKHYAVLKGLIKAAGKELVSAQKAFLCPPCVHLVQSVPYLCSSLTEWLNHEIKYIICT